MDYVTLHMITTMSRLWEGVEIPPLALWQPTSCMLWVLLWVLYTLIPPTYSCVSLCVHQSQLSLCSLLTSYWHVAVYQTISRALLLTVTHYYRQLVCVCSNWCSIPLCRQIVTYSISIDSYSIAHSCVYMYDHSRPHRCYTGVYQTIYSSHLCALHCTFITHYLLLYSHSFSYHSSVLTYRILSYTLASLPFNRLWA